MEFLKIVFDNKTSTYFELREMQGRYYLYYSGYKIGELIDGEQSLKKYYKGDIQLWINKLRTRDINRISKISQQIINLKKEEKILLNRWSLFQKE